MTRPHSTLFLPDISHRRHRTLVYRPSSALSFSPSCLATEVRLGSPRLTFDHSKEKRKDFSIRPHHIVRQRVRTAGFRSVAISAAPLSRVRRTPPSPEDYSSVMSSNFDGETLSGKVVVVSGGPCGVGADICRSWQRMEQKEFSDPFEAK